MSEAGQDAIENDRLALPRRHFLLAASVVGLLAALPAHEACATEAQVAELIKLLVGHGELREGRVKLDIPLLVENGNAVPMTVSVDGGFTGPQRVSSLHVFAQRNPLPHVASFSFGPRAGRPVIATRIRLATSQTVIAVAKLADGSCWSDRVELIVTLAACVE
jgi:sulfur-oxidizing protein SoxY